MPVSCHPGTPKAAAEPELDEMHRAMEERLRDEALVVIPLPTEDGRLTYAVARLRMKSALRRP